MKLQYRILFTALIMFGWVNESSALGLPTAGAVYGDSASDLAARIPKRYGIFEEPLQSIGKTDPAEWSSLEQAITVYRSSSDPVLTEAIEAWLAAHPQSAWAGSLWLNLGLAHKRAGDYSEALRMLEQARISGATASGAAERAVGERALAELLDLNARLGHDKDLARLLDSPFARAESGAATAAVSRAKGDLWLMRNAPQDVRRCGVIALAELYKQGIHDKRKLDGLLLSKADARGLSLAQLQRLAQRAGFEVSMIRRTPGSSIPFPAVVHWKAGHYASILEEQNGRYRVRDTALAEDIWMRKEVLERQSSGYFLVPQGQIQAYGSWQSVGLQEANKIRGAGATGANNPNQVGQDAPTDGGDKPSCQGMPFYTVSSLLVSLKIDDKPLGCHAAVGPSLDIRLTYNQLDTAQPSTFSFSNMGPKWTHNWMSWIQDDPANIGQSVRSYLPGGGPLPYSGYNASTGAFAPETLRKAMLYRVVENGAVRYERRMADGTAWIYAQSDGSTATLRRFFLTKLIDPQGNAVSLTYDSTLRLVQITDATGQVMQLQYGDTSRPLLVTGFTDPFGRTASIGYDSNGRVSSLTDAMYMTSSFTYEGASTNINTMTTPYGTTTFNVVVNGRQRWMEITDPLGLKERIEFYEGAPGIASSENVVPNTGSISNSNLIYRNSFYWDKNAMAQGAGDYTKARIKHWLHDGYLGGYASGVLESTKNPLESRVWYIYDGQPVSVSGTSDQPTRVARVLDDNSTQSTVTGYNGLGNVTSSVDAVLRKTQFDYYGNQIDVQYVKQITASGYDVLASYTYNGQHQPLTYTDAAGQTTQYTYNGFGQLTSVTNALSQKTTYVYDDAHHLRQEIDANNQVRYAYTYDTVGRVATRTDSEGYTLTYGYDDFDRLVQILYPDSTMENFNYDKLDLSSYTDRAGNTTTYNYDALRRLQEIVDPLGHTQSFTYHPGGQLATLTDGNGHTTSWDIDLQGRVKAKHFADSTQQTTLYETRTSRVHSTTDALSQTKTYGYALDDRLRSVSYTNAINATPNVSWVWDNYYPRQSSMSDGTGTTQYQYLPINSLGALQLASEDGPYANDGIGYTYDEIGRQKTRTVDTAAAESLGYDALGRLQTRGSVLGQFTYDYLGGTTQLKQLSVAGHPYTTVWNYLGNNEDRRLAGITHTAPNGTPLRSYMYQTNVLGQITQRTTWSAGGAAPISPVESAGYDYDLDPASNLTAITAAGVVTPLVPTNTNALLSYGNVPLTTDAAGNVTDDGERTYKWDAENRLSEIAYKSQPGKKSSFRYDGLSRRVAIVETASQGATPTEQRFLWCGEAICQERSQADAVTKRFFPEGEYRVAGGQQILYNRDSLGSVRDAQLLNTNSPYAGAADYDPYGQGVGNGLSFQYAGMYLHSTSGLYLTHYRTYDAKRARWLSRDPIAEIGGSNLYAYVNGNPISKIDPLGLWGVSAGFGGGGAIGAGASAWSGGYYSPDACKKSGGFTSTGSEWGLGGGLGVQFGLFFGDGTDLFSGDGAAYTVTILDVNIGVTFSNGQVSGVTFGAAAGLPLGATVTKSNTKLH
jgi:RHS repeat-associated protein